MKKNDTIIELANQIIENEADAIMGLKRQINEDFQKTVEMMLENKGSLVFSGIGKSAIIAQKIVATMNSTGSSAVFMHAADAIHGDLGMVQPDDVVICISKSGNTPEIKVLVPLIKNFGNKLIAMVGNTDSFLAKQADIVLNCTVDHEACPNNLAPTSSTTAQLVMGDALAVALIECRGFSASDFARFHPGGALGKQLYLHVDDLFRQNERPQVAATTSVRDTILEMTSKRLGCAVVTDEQRHVLGIVTDGDLRRMMKAQRDTDSLTAGDIMTRNPKCIAASEYAVNALHLMQANSITQLVVVDNDGHYEGVLHLHDILKEGII